MSTSNSGSSMIGAGGGESSSSTQLSDPFSVNSLDDVQYLLYLETLKRFRDDEANIKRQVEEKMGLYKTLEAEYERLYRRYAMLVQLAASHTVLDGGNYFGQAEEISEALASVTQLENIIASDQVTGCLDAEQVEQCKQKLAKHKDHNQLRQLSQDVCEIKTLVKGIQTAMLALESTVETATLQGVDHFVKQFQLPEMSVE